MLMTVITVQAMNGEPAFYQDTPALLILPKTLPPRPEMAIGKGKSDLRGILYGGEV